MKLTSIFTTAALVGFMSVSTASLFTQSASAKEVTDATVSAQPIAMNSATLNTTATTQTLSPFNLVALASQGYFKSQGIPSSGALISAYQSGKIGAQDLVKGAIASHRLSPQTLNNQAYLNAVATQLQFWSPRD